MKLVTDIFKMDLNYMKFNFKIGFFVLLGILLFCILPFLFDGKPPPIKTNADLYEECVHLATVRGQDKLLKACSSIRDCKNE
jgi:hypothetical protein